MEMEAALARVSCLVLLALLITPCKGADRRAQTRVCACADLVRDVQVEQVAAMEGVMVGLQREVLGLFLAAYDGNDANVQSISTFITHSIRHHVAHAQLPDVAVHQDELLMGVLSRNNVDLCRQAVLGIGLESMRASIATCEAQGCWFEVIFECITDGVFTVVLIGLYYLIGFIYPFTFY